MNGLQGQKTYSAKIAKLRRGVYNMNRIGGDEI